MIPRTLNADLGAALSAVPAVALLGPRQVGKTTLALSLGRDSLGKDLEYLDLERDSDLAKLDDPEAYLKRLANRLVVIDEAQRKPDLFRTLRSLIDERKRHGESSCQFLLLGSASRDLLQESSESLAGRIRYLELSPLTIYELRQHDPSSGFERHWLRGGYPDSFLSPTELDSWEWRRNFINTYLERDIPQMGPRIPSATMKRFWTMLSHSHGQQANLSSFAKSLEKSHTTIRSYLDTLTDFYMVRQLPPWSGNTKKRLVKSPKIYLRDSGLLHSLLGIGDMESLLGHPVAGASWEGFAIENILSNLDSRWRHSYYRTASQAEIDLILEGPNKQTVAVEIKRSPTPRIDKGFHIASEDIRATAKAVVHGGSGSHPMQGDIQAFGLWDFIVALRSGQV